MKGHRGLLKKMWILFSKLGDENANVYMDLTGNVNKWSGPGVKQIVIWGLCRYHANYCQHMMSNRWSWPSDCTCTRCSQYSVTFASTHNPNTMWSQRRGSPPPIAGNQEGITDEIVFEMDLRKEQEFVSLFPVTPERLSIQAGWSPPGPTTPHTLSSPLSSLSLSGVPRLPPSLIQFLPTPNSPMQALLVHQSHAHCPGSKCSLRMHQGHATPERLGDIRAQQCGRARKGCLTGCGEQLSSVGIKDALIGSVTPGRSFCLLSLVAFALKGSLIPRIIIVPLSSKIISVILWRNLISLLSFP